VFLPFAIIWKIYKKISFAFTSFTVMNSAQADFERNLPYTVAPVKLAVGPKVMAQLTDLGGKLVKIGMPVEMVTRLIKEDGDEGGMQIYGYAKHSLY
jgi:hypothetical protein